MTTCKSCGAKMLDNALKCPGCGAAQTKTGFLGSLWKLLFKTSLKTTITRNERVVIKDSKTGTTKEFDSIEEVPAEYQEKIRDALQSTGFGPVTTIRFTDASGKTFTYNSIREMPPEQRALYETAMRSGLANNKNRPTD